MQAGSTAINTYENNQAEYFVTLSADELVTMSIMSIYYPGNKVYHLLTLTVHPPLQPNKYYTQQLALRSCTDHITEFRVFYSCSSQVTSDA